MSRWLDELSKAGSPFVVVAIVFAMSSCAPIPLHYRSTGEVRSAPLDCFPGLAADPVDRSDDQLAATDPVPIELPFDLSGSWAQQETTTTWANVPLLGEVQTVMVNTVRLDLTQNGNRLEGTAEVCGLVSLDTGNATRTIIPDSFVRAIGPSLRRAVVEPVDSGGVRYRQERYTRVMGVDLENPETDPLPDRKDDPRVLDDDQDGNPGVTVQVEGMVNGEIYLVQRHWKELCGDVLSDDHIQGYLLWDTDQQIVDASSFLLRRNPTTRIDPDWEANTFQMHRIDPNMGCEEIMANQQSIFGTAQPAGSEADATVQ
ncbi:MAG: hypothetical protein JW797_08285 [Bradymonadales bacterium]|nr:hypothetical protein [Bradymonadales bacterium]